MLGFSDDPFGIYYYPRQTVRVYHPYYIHSQRVDPYNYIGNYMKALDDAFNQMYAPLEDLYYEQDSGNQIKNEEPDQSKATQPENEKADSDKPKENPKPASPEKSVAPKKRAKSSVFSSHSNGGIEEICEKTFDSKTGQTITSKIRRIGDRWCRIESTKDKDGNEQKKETWHNVSEDEIESFKDEWMVRRGFKMDEHKAIQANETKSNEEDQKKAEEPEKTK